MAPHRTEPSAVTQADAIEVLEAKIAEAQSELVEAVETAQEVAAYEPEEDETVTAAVIKKALKREIFGEQALDDGKIAALSRVTNPSCSFISTDHDNDRIMIAPCCSSARRARCAPSRNAACCRRQT